MTASASTGWPPDMQSAEPESPVDAMNVVPLAATIASASSSAVIACGPPGSLTANSSQSPSDAEITCGRRPGLCRGAVSAWSVETASARVSYTSIAFRSGAAASRISRSSVVSGPGASSLCTVPTP